MARERRRRAYKGESYFEYSVRQELYDPSWAGADGLEQGYRIPHACDHHWPDKTGSSEQQHNPMVRLNGPLIDENGSMHRLGTLMRKAGRA